MLEPRKRTRRKADRPAELLEAALDSFMVNGFAATRMEDIAARVGVSKGTIYLYFPSKQALFEALVRAKILPNIERIEALTADPADRPSTQLRRILELMTQVASNPRIVAIPKMVVTEAGSFPDLARFYRREVLGRGLGLLEGALLRGMEAGEFRRVDALALAQLFMAPVVLTGLWRSSFALIEEPPTSATELLSLHADLFLRAITIQPGSE